MEHLCPTSCQSTTCDRGNVAPSPPPPGARPPPPPTIPPPAPPPPPLPPTTGCTAPLPIVAGGSYGFHGALRGTAATLTCDGGRTVSTQGSMITCTNNVWSAPGTCACGPGQSESNDGSRSCVPCGEGMFRPAGDLSGQCRRCPANTQPSALRSECVPCPYGMSTYTCDDDAYGSSTCGTHPTCRRVPPPPPPPIPAPYSPPSGREGTAPEPGGESSSNGMYGVIIVVAIIGVVAWKKQQDGVKGDMGGSSIYGDSAIYAPQNVSEHVDDTGAKHVTIKAPGSG